MNQAHLHLLANHFPIIVPFIGLLVMLGGFVFRSEMVKRTSYAIFILGAIGTLPAFFSGEGAEEVIEGLQGIDKKMIHTHEEAAEIFAILSYLLGGLALIGLWSNWKQKSFSNIIGFLIMIFAVVVLFFAKQTGTTGGEIRHTEIRTGAAVGNATEQPNENEEDEKD